jgi:chemotaxis protein MotA
MAESKMSVSAVGGIVIGLGALIGGFLLDGGKPSSLIGVPALIIITGGTVGALLLSYNLKDVMSIPRLVMQAMKPARSPSPQLAQMIVGFAEKARRDGLLALEEVVEDIEDETLRKTLQMVIDGADMDAVVDVAETDIAVFEQRRREEAAIFETAGGFSPTMGIIGTVMGLVLVLTRIGGDAAAMGHSIATAFIATLYGIGLANLFWLPIGNKLKYQVKQMRLEKELIVSGVRSIQQGENPTLVWQRIANFLEEGDRRAVEAERTAT